MRFTGRKDSKRIVKPYRAILTVFGCKEISIEKFNFTKANRLRKRSEFIYVSSHGSKVQNRHFIAYFISNHQRTSRLGITTTKRIGKAVKRNRIKRSAREYFRINRKHLGNCLDINVIAKKESADLTSKEIFFALDHLFHKLKGG